MNQWHSSVTKYLESRDYEKVVNIYEEMVENNPDEIINYWYLGLGYLLIGKQDEAQTTWFIIFSQGDDEDIEVWNRQLTEILAEEALQQLYGSYYDQSLLIRQQILEIEPNNINNLLHIVNLEILLKQFKVENLGVYDLIELVKNSEQNSLDFLLLSTLLNDILKYPNKLSIDFAEAILIYTDTNPEIVSIIKNNADYMTKEEKYTCYAINLLETCNKYPHNDVNILIFLYADYQLVKNFDKLISIAEEFDQKAQHFADKFNAKNLLLNAYLTLAEWEKARELIPEQYKLYEEIKSHRDDLANSPTKDTFFSGILNLLYLKDDARNNRQMINRVSGLFQEINQLPSPIIHPQPQEKKVLTIGYVSHTLRKHSVGYLSRWLIAHHDRNSFKINLYFTQPSTDEFTEKWFKPHADKMLVMARGMNKLADQIYQDQVDILIDLDSLTLNLTALLMAMKPAPIQVTWLGMDASGIPNIDYFIADPFVLPDSASEYYSEKIWRLPNTYLAVDGFEIGSPTLRRGDLGISGEAVIFLNLQNPAKCNPDIIKLQMEVIKQVSNSYLVFKVRRDDSRLKKYIYSLAEKYDLDDNRLRFINLDDTVETHRANLSIADVFFDTYPYNGATTTLEALWSEIPVITKAGEQFASRNSYGFMMNAGITEGIAWSDEEYVQWGVKLGKDENLRQEISWKLKRSKQTSPLWNGIQFAREMEKAYQQMWNIYINENQ